MDRLGKRNVFCRALTIVLMLLITLSLAFGMSVKSFVSADDSASKETTLSDEEVMLEAEKESSDVLEISSDKSVLDDTEYIAKNIDSKYAKANKFEPKDLLYVKQTMAIGSKLPANDKTLHGLWRADNASHMDAYVNQLETLLYLYNTDDSSDYYVAFADTMHTDESSQLAQAVFAYANTNAELVNDCIFDANTGLAYIPKKYTKENKNGYGFGNIAVQFLQLVETYTPDINVDVVVDKTNTKGDIASTGVIDVDSDLDVIQIQLAENNKAIDNLDEDYLKVSVNGFDISKYDYNNETGVLSVNASPATVNNIKVEIDRPGFWSRTASAVGDFWSDVKSIFTGENSIKASAIKFDDMTPVTKKPWIILSDSGITLTDEFKGEHFKVKSKLTYNTGGYGAQNTYYPDNSGGLTDADMKRLVESVLGEDKVSFDEYVQDSTYVCWQIKTLADEAVKIGSSDIKFNIPTTTLYCKCAELTAADGGIDGKLVQYKGDVVSVQMYMQKIVRAQSDKKFDGYLLVYAAVGRKGTAGVSGQVGAGAWRIPFKFSEPETENVYPGALTIGKDSSNYDIVYTGDGNTHYSIAGAQFTVKGPYKHNADGSYTEKYDADKAKEIMDNLGATFKTKVQTPRLHDVTNSDGGKTFTTGSDGTVTIKGLWEGQYLITETVAPKGFGLPTKKSKYIKVWNSESGSENDAGHVNGADYDPDWIYFDDPPMTGSISISKLSSHPGLSTGNCNYSLAGAKFTATNNETHAVYNFPDTNAQGGATLSGIPLGSYSIKEVSAPKGFALNVSPVGVEITSVSTTGNNSISDETNNDPVTLALYKKDKETGEKWIGNQSGNVQGNASLAGAEYQFMIYDSKTITREQILNGDVTPLVQFKMRTKNVTDRTGANYGQIAFRSEYLVEGTWQSKYNYTFNDFLDARGRFMLPEGTIAVYETKAPEGYILPSVEESLKFTHLENIGGSVTFEDFNPYTEEEKVIRGGFSIKKSDKNRIETEPTGDENLGQGDATSLDAVFEVTNMSDEPVIVNNQTYQPNQVCFTFTTDSKGLYTSAADLLPYGTYKVTEKTAPTGYNVDTSWSKTFNVTNDGEIVQLNDYSDNPIKEAVYRGGVKVQKIDLEFNEDKPQGDGTLKGAVFAIYNVSDMDVYIQTGDNKGWFEPAKADSSDPTGYNLKDKNICYKITTNTDDGIAQCADILPYGTYIIKEYSPSTGYLLNTDWYKKFSIRQDHQVIDYSETGNYDPCAEQVIRGDVRIEKWDKEIHISEAIGGDNHGSNNYGTTLSGIDFEIKNVSQHHVQVPDDGSDIQVNNKAITITTYWNESLHKYVAETTKKSLPYGTYTIQEVATNETYLLTDGTVYTFEIRKDGSLVTNDKSSKLMKYEDYVVRGDIEFRKIANMTSERMNTLWTLTNESTGEVHVIAADQNGEYYSAANHIPHSKNTNANDKFLERIKAGEVINMSEVERKAGTWFYLGEDGMQSKVFDKYTSDYIYDTGLTDDSYVGADGSTEKPSGGRGNGEFVGALPYGKYTLQEVATDTNRDYTLQRFVFYIYRHGYVADLGTIEDYDVSISTIALDDATGEHIGYADGTVVIEDKVDYKGITKGNKYRMVGYLYDADTGEAIINAEGNPVTAETEFTAKGGTGTVIVSFKTDGDSVKGRRVVCFEELYSAEGGKMAEEKDLTNEDQTIVYPSIETTLTYNDDHDVPTMGKVTITDRVEYKNLVPGKKYKLIGTLMDKETGDNLLDEDGKEIVIRKDLVPEEANGYIDIEFEVDGSKLIGHTLVAFEELTYRNSDIAVHFDIEDENQTVYFPELHTTALDNVTSLHETYAVEDTSITDTVAYKNLMSGRTYKVSGILMDKATGESVKDAEGNEITSETEFVPETSEGTVNVEFTFDASNYAGQTFIVYETLTKNDEVYATHEDIEDEDQSIHFPKIGTSAIDGDSKIRSGVVGEKATIVDTVKYENLMVGETYTMTGTLMEKESASELTDAEGNPITASTEFTPEEPNGSVDVVFEFDSSLLGNTDLVAFEVLTHGEFTVADHQDIEDEDQTVEYPVIGTTAVYGDTDMHEGLASDKIKIVDTVRYQNLIVGTEYIMSGTLMNKATGEPITDAEGNPVTASTVFTPEEPDGSVEVIFEFDASALAGQTVVAFESLKYTDVELTTHEDIEDEEQSVHLPKIGTTALGSVTETHMLDLNESAMITDTVAYENLIPGNSYTVTGTLMDKETNKPLMIDEKTPVTGTADFIAEEANGEVVVTFTVDSTLLAGKTFVAFEDLSSQDVKIATHSDITDEAQTVYMMNLDTVASGKDGKSKTIEAAKKAVIVDTVTYSNLIPGVEYSVTGDVVNKKTGKAVVDDKVVKFTPKKTEGTVEVEFTVDTTELSGETLVCYETVTDSKGNILGSHIDINDKDQSVLVQTVTIVQTGVNKYARPVMWSVIVATAIFALLVACVILYKKHKLNKALLKRSDI